MVEYQNLYKAFDTPVLAGVSLTVQTGETLAVLGPSGTGKSVLLKTTIGLIHPDGGDVKVDGESVFFGGGKALHRIRRKVGYVFQNAALFDSMTVLDNVAQGIPEEDLRGLRRADLVARVADALEHVNLNPRVVMSKLPSELSGGMRKRVGLARAIVGKPEILLYDEPVTGLDPMNSGIVHRLIANLAEELGVTSIIVTHDIEGALGISDHVALLESGKIRFVGTPLEFRESDDPIVRGFMGRDVEDLEAESLNTLETV
jgi:phospholipid/cholesterol/gamma-HCH transport system ATP-binding protein